MRVITGSARGAKLKTLEGLATRPTSDRVKEAIFNIIQFDIQGRRVLDLFGGSGQLAIEALSRGADYAVIVDQSAEAVKVIKDNLKKTKFDQQASVFQMDYLRYLSTAREKFDLIFLDPPYAEKSLENALQKISEIDILSEGGIIICERPKDKVMPPEVGGLLCSRDYNYGKTAVNLYTR
ncbi:MAG: 16S rRNA (guanine(966)-N(2))-methyltransferase RsmD [Oscillospiraceae bacterium]|nr:16S rRNA (guanine(966)-N(2))-methyltransferase RsmD [Oscillospiraceae bacterium]